MKPPAFTYHRPETLEEALELLESLGERARVLAGGQSLMPLLNMRLARPEHLVDINRIAELAGWEFTDRALRVGALVRHSQIEDDPRVAERLPLLHEAVGYIGHRAIRNRGTVVGSLVHADPAAELPVVLLALQGRVEARSRRGSRWIEARDFFLAPFTSALVPGELAVAAEFPLPPPRTSAAFVEYALRDGDFALASVAVLLTWAEDGRTVASARIAVGGVEPVPRVLEEAAARMEGHPLTRERIDQAAAAAAAAVEPAEDPLVPAEYRRHLVRGLTVRAVAAAARRGGVSVAA